MQMLEMYEVADMLGLSRAHTLRLMSRGDIHSVLIGSLYYAELEDVRQFAAEQEEFQREYAERVAYPDKIREGAIRELMKEM